MGVTKTTLLERARHIADKFDVNDEDVRRCATEFIRELRLGLQQETPSMCQIPTYVTQISSGSENVGVTVNLMICYPSLIICPRSQLPVPAEVMVAETAQELFLFIAKRIEDFLKTYHQPALELAEKDSAHPFFSLGFTFSFPAYQTAVNSGILLRWTKGFDIPGAVNQDVCVLLQTEIDRLRLPVKVTALVNDAMGTIMSRAYSLPISNERPAVGAIFGTGTNGVYMEQLQAVSKHLDGEFDSSSGRMFMSTEWGSFDNKLSVLPVTPYDTKLDRNSVNPGNQMFEKRISGMFLGELLRLAVLELYGDGWSVNSSVLSVAQADTTYTLLPLRKKIGEAFEIPEGRITVEDAQAVKAIAFAIGRRAAWLAGMAIGSVILQGKLLEGEGSGVQVDKKVDVAVDGSVVEHYPGFETYMREALQAMDGIGKEGEARIVIGHTKDGSSVGAAIIALLAAQQVAPNTRHL
ncbi:glucokinase [Diaporthe eres]